MPQSDVYMQKNRDQGKVSDKDQRLYMQNFRVADSTYEVPPCRNPPSSSFSFPVSAPMQVRKR